MFTIHLPHNAGEVSTHVAPWDEANQSINTDDGKGNSEDKRIGAKQSIYDDFDDGVKTISPLATMPIQARGKKSEEKDATRYEYKNADNDEKDRQDSK